MSTPLKTRVTDTHNPVVGTAVARAIGEELRLAREEKGWSRGQLTKRVPSGIGVRTLLSYEHGARNLLVLRLIELCQALEISAGGLVNTALQRARINLKNMVLRVDLLALLDDDLAEFRPMHQWARNKFRRQANRVAEVEPATVDELADFVGCDRHDLANHLAKFIPDQRPPADDAPPEEAVVHEVLLATAQ